MKKICVVTKSMFAGGAERVIAQLVNYLAEQNIACSIVTMDQEKVLYELHKDVTLTAIGKKSNNKIADRIKRYGILRKMMKKEKPDIILSMPEDTGIYVLAAMLGTGIPVVVSERNNPWVMPDVKITRILRKWMYPFAKGIIFQTEMAKSFFPKRIQKKGIVLPNPVDASRIPEAYCGERDKRIAAVGRLSSQKNFPMLIQAFAKFSKEHSDYRLVIYGDGSQRETLEKLIVQLGLADRVELPGRNQQVLEEIRKAAMFVLSSDYEGMPNVLIEAMCMGMPVISTDCPSGGPRQLIENGVNGLLVPVGDADSMCQAMLRMTNYEDAKRMASSAYQLRENATSEDVFRRWSAYLFGLQDE